MKLSKLIKKIGIYRKLLSLFFEVFGLANLRQPYGQSRARHKILRSVSHYYKLLNLNGLRDSFYGHGKRNRQESVFFLPLILTAFFTAGKRIDAANL